MQAAYRLQKCTDQVIYVNDGHIAKTLQSGHQGHTHPSEWTAEECSSKNLFKTMLKGFGVLPQDDPSDLARYSYLHFPMENVLKHPRYYLGIYSQFFYQRIIHNLTSVNGVSAKDHWVCDGISKSLSFHQKLSDQIEKETGKKTFSQQSRVYWSPNLTAMKKKEKTWKELGIACTFMDPSEIMQRTLLKTDAKLHILQIFNDGKFYPETIPLIVDHLSRHYPHFTARTGFVEKILIDPKTSAPHKVLEKDPATQKTIQTSIKTLIGSPGHNEVLRYDPEKKLWSEMWQEVPVSGISSVWLCEIEKSEMLKRFAADLSDQELQERMKSIVAAANLSNLHVTSWDCTIKDKTIQLLVRATQGANFNSLVASKSDLFNMANNLNIFFIGHWTLISVGTCTRKTWTSNVPEFARLHDESGFIHGLSGLGYSFSAAPPEHFHHSAK